MSGGGIYERRNQTAKNTATDPRASRRARGTNAAARRARCRRRGGSHCGAIPSNGAADAGAGRKKHGCACAAALHLRKNRRAGAEKARRKKKLKKNRLACARPAFAGSCRHAAVFFGDSPRAAKRRADGAARADRRKQRGYRKRQGGNALRANAAALSANGQQRNCLRCH